MLRRNKLTKSDKKILFCAYFSSFSNFISQSLSHFKEFSIKVEQNFVISVFNTPVVEKFKSGFFKFASNVRSWTFVHTQIKFFTFRNSFKEFSKRLFVDSESNYSIFESEYNCVPFLDLYLSKNVSFWFFSSLLFNCLTICWTIFPIISISIISFMIRIIIVFLKQFQISVNSY